MPMNYLDLTPQVREYMREEVEFDGGDLYGSAWFNSHGVVSWKGMLLEACSSGDDATLANRIAQGPFLRTMAERKTKNGVTMVRVPGNAHETIADNNFSRFYLRGVCRYAIANGIPHVVGYRAKAVESPRPGSEEKIGMLFNPQAILDDLRATMAGQPALGMPPGVGSGILAHLPR